MMEHHDTVDTVGMLNEVSNIILDFSDDNYLWMQQDVNSGLVGVGE
jgi:hypothetical protein